MKGTIREIIAKALDGAIAGGALKTRKPVILERPKREEFGDFSTNLAMLLAPEEGRSPRDIASILVEGIAASPVVARCEVAGPGFINIFLKRSYWYSILAEILRKGEGYGDLDTGGGEKIQVEFVSANPTGPLHIGHGRGAAVGDACANVLKAAGFDVTREYYINDVGRQMETLGRSLFLRYQELLGMPVEFPDDYYRGEYMKEIARDFLTKYGTRYRDARPGEPGDDSLPVFVEFAKDSIMSGIKKDLADFGVGFDVWYSEKDLFDKGLVEETLKELEGRNVLYEKDGALWFRTTDYGDDKDRVLVKADGSTTYFASDTAYHREKLKRGFKRIVDVWGADHHGYQPRMKALFKALGEDEERLKIIFIQLVSLSRGGVPLKMSTRAGEFITLREVMEEVGKDACRFFFLMRRPDAHLDFDLELAKKQAPENPVYYVQYCHARIMSIMEFARERGVDVPDVVGPDTLKELSRLDQKEEVAIIKHLAGFEEVIEKSAVEMEPHRVTFYLQELAGLFHPYYNRNRVVTDDPGLTTARLLLCRAVATVVAKGLGLLGVSAPKKM